MRPTLRASLATAGLAVVAGPATPADDALPGPVQATAVTVVDGDTFDARARVWLGQEVSIRVRLLGIDAPELRGACAAERAAALAARETLKRAVLGAAVQLWDVRWDKYGG